MTAPAPKLRYMPGLDGLRALAVAAVLVYHLGATWLPGGFLGVDVFLVISGYLITSLLLAERRASGRIDLRRFWLRRARRLLPAVILMIVVVLAAMVVLHPGEVARLHGAVIASFAYVANWYFAFADVPYFEQFGRPSIFQHLWSLAVEEQFYLLWPPVLGAALLFFSTRRVLAGIGVAMVASTALAWALWEPFSDPSRIYYGTDTRAAGLLAGVALALVWPAARRTAAPRPGARTVLDLLGLACLAALLVAMGTLGDLDEALYKGGFLVVALATAGLVAVLAHPSSRLARAFGLPVLVWLGLRSYGIYLWHWPVIMLTRPQVDVPLDGAPLVVLRLGLILAAAALSYRYVETPFRRLGVRGVRDAIAGWGRGVGRPVRVATASSACLFLAGLTLAVVFLPAQTPNVPGLTGVASASGQTLASLPSPERQAQAARAAESAGTARAAKQPLLMVGDSVMLGTARELRRVFGRRTVIDAKVARQFEEGAAAVRKGLRLVPRTATVVIHLGNNGYVPFKALQRLMDDLARRPRVVLVTVRVPLKWEKSVNDALRYAQRTHPNTVIADWHAASGGRGLLVDGAHPTARGIRLYAKTIAAALTK